MPAWIALFILALAAMLLVSNGSGTIANLDSNTFGYVALGTALLVFVGGGVVARYRGQADAMFRDAVTWVALGLALVTIYSYRDELLPVAGRLAGELLPGSAMVVEQSPNGPVEVKIRKRLDGHFTVKAKINGTSTTMIVDTGASTIVLRPEDAKNAGIDASSQIRTQAPHTRLIAAARSCAPTTPTRHRSAGSPCGRRADGQGSRTHRP